LLALDIGNTNVKAGLFDGGKLVWTASAPNAAGLLPKLKEIPNPGTVAASSVRPGEDMPVREAVREAFGLTVAFLGRELPAGIPILCEQPEKVGADRLANAIAAFHRAQGRVIAVDFGTAIAFDFVSERGEFMGGAIAPGLSTCLDALHEKAALLPRVPVAEPPSAVGNNTVNAILAGVIGGLPGLVDRIIENVEIEQKCRFTVYATGGDSRVLAPRCRRVDEVILSLTLEGVYLAAQQTTRTSNIEQ